MNNQSYLLPVLIIISLHSPVECSWRLGKPRKVTPTIANLNTYTLSPIKGVPEPVNPLQVRDLTKAIQHHKSPDTASLTIHEKNSTDRIKYIKGYSTITKGVASVSEPYITIVLRGYARTKNPKNGLPQQGGGIVDTYTRLRNNLAFTPVVAFDLPDERRSFNFGQELDQACIKVVYDEVVAKNPHAKIILTGDCRGSLNALKFATTNPKNLDAIVLLSPFTSAKELTQELSKNYLQNYFGKGSNTLLQNFFQWWFPNYDPAQDNLMEQLDKITGKKIFIAHRIGDTLVSDETVTNLAEQLNKNNDLYLALINDTSAKHAKLMQITECQELINAFYERYSMPCNHHLAQLGKKGLTVSKEFGHSVHA